MPAYDNKAVELRGPLSERLQRVVDEALSAADITWQRERQRYSSIPELAEKIFEEQPVLMEEAKKVVLMERLIWLIKRRKFARFAAKYQEYSLPGFDLPRTVYIKNGSRPQTDHCNSRQIDEAIRILESQARERQNPKILRLKAARELMDQYQIDNRDITWGEVKRKELERRDFDRLVGS